MTTPTQKMIPLHIADQAVAACDAEIQMLRAEVERLAGDCHENSTMGIERDFLRAEVERLTQAAQGSVKYVDSTMAHTRGKMKENELIAQVERLTKAGNQMADDLRGEFGDYGSIGLWHAAKEGKTK